MAAGAWGIYNTAKKKIGNGTINLGATTFRISLHTSGYNGALTTIGVYNSVGSEVANGSGYTTGGVALTGEVWTVGASAGQYKFDCSDPAWSASGGAIANIKNAVIYVSAAASAGKHLLCRSVLSTAAFSLSSGNSLTIQMASAGVFTLA